MLTRSPNLSHDGYEVIDNVMASEMANTLEQSLPAIDNAGTRRLFDIPEIRNAVYRLRQVPGLMTPLSNLVAVQCTYFLKSQHHNWSVPLHRDSVVLMKGQGSWECCGTKESLTCVRPPRWFLEQCLAVRVHLDGAPEGDLFVVRVGAKLFPGLNVRDMRSWSILF